MDDEIEISEMDAELAALYKEMDDFFKRCDKEGKPTTAEERRKRDAEFLETLKRCNDRSWRRFQTLNQKPGHG